MAEIPIERKQSRNWLPILGALLALLLLGLCFLRRDRGATTATNDSAAAAGATTGAAAGDTAARTAAASGAGAAGAAGGAAGGAVDEFVRFVATRDTSSETEGNHQYTATGVRLLASSLDEVANAGAAGASGGSNAVDIRAYADSMRRSVDRLQQSAEKDVHADDARAAFNAAVSAIAVIDKARGRTRDVEPMRAIARELDPRRPLVPQLGVVHRFFEAARGALEQMRGTA